jgi:putative DNA primase/helicase
MAVGAQREAALDYAARGWPVFPSSIRKHPLTKHGLREATCDEAQIISWWKHWPDALVAMVTGELSGIVALDIDVADPMSGWDSLEELGVPFAPVTPMSHTPRGGTHCLFARPAHFVKTIAGKLGCGLDIRGDGGSLIMPPGPGRCWDPHYGFEVPLAPMPTWMVIPEAERTEPRPPASCTVRLSRYAEAALDSAIKAVALATAGSQRDTLNRECFAIAGLVAGGIIPIGLALEALTWAAHQMSSDPRRPWRAVELERVVRDAFFDGLQRPRVPA